MANAANWKLIKILVKMNITRTNNEGPQANAIPPSPAQLFPETVEQQPEPDSKSESNPDSDGDTISFTESQISYLLSNPFDPSYYAYFACEDLATGKLSEIDLVRYFNLQEWISAHEPHIFRENWNGGGLSGILDDEGGKVEGSNWGKGCAAALEVLKKIEGERDEALRRKRGLARERRWGRVLEGKMRRERDRAVLRNRRLVREKEQGERKVADQIGEMNDDPSAWSLVRSPLIVMGFMLLLLAIHRFWNGHNAFEEVFGS